jgi:hypothetical protein
MQGLEGREPKLTINGQLAPPAFVVVTNHRYHYDFDSLSTRFAVLSCGFKIPDYGLDGVFAWIS